MHGRCVFLHNSRDKPAIQAVFEVALRDLPTLGLEPWMDWPGLVAASAGGGALGGHDTTDAQIAAAVADAAAIIYFVGRSGRGQYQQRVEDGLVRETLQRRRGGGRPLSVLPVLLADASAGDLPDWAWSLNVVNFDRRLTEPEQLWPEIRERLRQTKVPQPGPPDHDDPVTILAEKVRSAYERPGLTVFIGPYSFAQRDEVFGPAALTSALLAEMQVSTEGLKPFALWPSEAAEWTRLARGQDAVRNVLVRSLGGIGLNPPDLTRQIGFLASNFARWLSKRASSSEDWHGLLLLTTRIDLALESSLALHAKVPFTRILPTVARAPEAADQRKLVQRWRPEPAWHPIVPPSGPARPSEDVGAAQGGRSRRSDPLDSAEPIVVVKLCGSLEVPSSLILTTSDFFNAAEAIKQLPKRLTEFVRATPQLFLGRGFASPLLQLVRREVFSERPTEVRFWVMPPDDKAAEGSPRDPLCDLELDLLERDTSGFTRSLETLLHREGQADFVRRLGERF